MQRHENRVVIVTGAARGSATHESGRGAIFSVIADGG